MIKEVLPLQDNVTLILSDCSGNLIKQVSTHNLVTHPGEMFYLDRMQARVNVDPVTTSQAYIAIGEGSIASDYWLSGLVNEVSGTGNLGRDVPTSVSRSTQTVLVGTYLGVTEGSGQLTEAGLFTKGYDSGGNLLTVSDAKDSGVLVAYASFDAITKDETNSLTIDWEFQV